MEIGVAGDQVRMRSFPNFGSFSKAMADREIPIMHLSWTLDYPDAENLLQLFYGPSASPGPNTANYANPVYDALFEAWRFRPPGPERTVAFRELNDMLVEDCVVIGGAAPSSVYVSAPGVRAHRANTLAGPFAWRFFARDR
jgi:ABC-type oligopeptide transport system substrate-binding subunit